MPFREYHRDQDWMFPPSLGEFLPPEHTARFVAEFVDQLNLSGIGIMDTPAAEGAEAYHPRMLLAVWLYGFMVRVRTTRRLERACRENIPFMWLSGLQRPDHTTLARFYQRNRPAMRDLLKSSVRLAVQVGLVEFAFHAVDGCRLPAAARSSLVTQDQLERLLSDLDQEIQAMEEAQRQEDGPDGRVLQHKAVQRERLQEAMRHLGLPSQGDEANDTHAPVSDAEGRAPKAKAGDVAATAEKPKTEEAEPDEPVVSSSDPEARLIKANRGFVVGYNGQTVVDSKAQIIVAADVVASGVDVDQLMPMLDEAQTMTGRQAGRAGVDGNYFSMENVLEAQRRGIELFVPDNRTSKRHSPEKPFHKSHFIYDVDTDTFTCPAGRPVTYSCQEPPKKEGGAPVRVYRGRECRGCPLYAECTKDRSRRIKIYGHEADALRHYAQMRTALAHWVMRQRMATVEPVFALLKEVLGFTRFLRRGLENARAEWRMVCTAHNLRKICKLWWQPQVRSGAAG
jgi:transposase